MQTQYSNNKNSSCAEEPKPKDLKSNLLRDNTVKLIKKKDKIDKKKKFQKYKQNYYKYKK